MTYALDLHTVGRWVVTCVTDGGESPPSVTTIATTYRPPNPADLTRVIGVESDVENENEAKEWMVRTVIHKLRRYLELEGDIPRFREGESLETARLSGRRLEPYRIEEKPPWADAFNKFKTAGIYVENIRVGLGRDSSIDEELRESMRLVGWLPFHPAIKDEMGVVLVGHRRLAIAAELAAEGLDIPIREGHEVQTVHLGSGTAADAARFRYSIHSNLGAKAFTKLDRQRIAQHLYGDLEWSQVRIAEALGVSQRTVSADLRTELRNISNPDRRPPGRRGPRRKLSSAQQAEAIRRVLDEGEPMADVQHDLIGTKGHSTVGLVIAEERGRREALLGSEDLPTEPAPEFSVTAHDHPVEEPDERKGTPLIELDLQDDGQEIDLAAAPEAEASVHEHELMTVCRTCGAVISNE